MNENKFGGYKIPNLYRQDLAYSNHKTTPVVVTGGVAYVPLSLFLSFSYVSVKYSDDENKFYFIKRVTDFNRIVKAETEKAIRYLQLNVWWVGEKYIYVLCRCLLKGNIIYRIDGNECYFRFNKKVKISIAQII